MCHDVRTIHESILLHFAKASLTTKFNFTINDKYIVMENEITQQNFTTFIRKGGRV